MSEKENAVETECWYEVELVEGYVQNPLMSELGIITRYLTKYKEWSCQRGNFTGATFEKYKIIRRLYTENEKEKGSE